MRSIRRSIELLRSMEQEKANPTQGLVAILVPEEYYESVHKQYWSDDDVHVCHDGMSKAGWKTEGMHVYNLAGAEYVGLLNLTREVYSRPARYMMARLRYIRGATGSVAYMHQRMTETEWKHVLAETLEKEVQ